jgi:hypothetical protein
VKCLPQIASERGPHALSFQSCHNIDGDLLALAPRWPRKRTAASKKLH